MKELEKKEWQKRIRESDNHGGGRRENGDGGWTWTLDKESKEQERIR